MKKKLILLIITAVGILLFIFGSIYLYVTWDNYRSRAKLLIVPDPTPVKEPEAYRYESYEPDPKVTYSNFNSIADVEKNPQDAILCAMLDINEDKRIEILNYIINSNLPEDAVYKRKNMSSVGEMIVCLRPKAHQILGDLYLRKGNLNLAIKQYEFVRDSNCEKMEIAGMHGGPWYSKAKPAGYERIITAYIGSIYGNGNLRGETLNYNPDFKGAINAAKKYIVEYEGPGSEYNDCDVDHEVFASNAIVRSLSLKKATDEEWTQETGWMMKNMKNRHALADSLVSSCFYMLEEGNTTKALLILKELRENFGSLYRYDEVSGFCGTIYYGIYAIGKTAYIYSEVLKMKEKAEILEPQMREVVKNYINVLKTDERIKKLGETQNIESSVYREAKEEYDFGLTRTAL